MLTPSRQSCRRLWRLTLCVALFAGTPLPAHAANVPWLFEVELPVADRGVAERRAAEQQGLQLVLRRVSGLLTLPDGNEQLREAYRNTARYYSQYGYVSRRLPTDPTREQMLLRLSFDPVLVQGLARDAGLPLWSLNRPQVIVWLAEEMKAPGPAGERRRIVTAADDHPLMSGLRDRARDRGLPLVLPAMDLPDQLNIAPVDVWGGFAGALERASARYAADVVVSGRLLADVFGGVRVDWRITGVESLDELSGEALDARAVGEGLADAIADALATRFAVSAEQALEAESITLRVSGIRAFDDYARLLAFLESLEAVREVAVFGGDARVLEFGVASVASARQLGELLSLHRQLSLVPTARNNPLVLDLRWTPQ